MDDSRANIRLADGQTDRLDASISIFVVRIACGQPANMVTSMLPLLLFAATGKVVGYLIQNIGPAGKSSVQFPAKTMQLAH